MTYKKSQQKLNLKAKPKFPIESFHIRGTKERARIKVVKQV
jgi:hypothetical protein